jgi:phage host-nuclease inhibitor protein Gam
MFKERIKELTVQIIDLHSEKLSEKLSVDIRDKEKFIEIENRYKEQIVPLVKELHQLEQEGKGNE